MDCAAQSILLFWTSEKCVVLFQHLGSNGGLTEGFTCHFLISFTSCPSTLERQREFGRVEGYKINLQVPARCQILSKEL